MNFLSRIEEILLLAIWKLGDEAFGISIRKQVEKDTGVKWLSGAVYAPLSRLKKNGYVTTELEDSDRGQKGRPRLYYKLTPLGINKLISIQEVNRCLWSNVPELKKVK